MAGISEISIQQSDPDWESIPHGFYRSRLSSDYIVVFPVAVSTARKPFLTHAWSLTGQEMASWLFD